MPLLTTELPREFGLHQLKGDWAVLAHASPFLDTAFIAQRGLIESNSYSVSSSLLTPKSQQLVRPVDIVALVSGAPEAISHAGRKNLSTGENVDWHGHVNQTSTPHPHMLEVASDVVGSGARAPKLWKTLTERLSEFDTLTELQNSTDTHLIDAHAKLLESLTTEQGRPIASNNEVKLHNATISGFGILRRGRPVFFTGMDATGRQQMLNGEPAPPWLSWTEANGSIMIPESIWREAWRRRLPLVVIDSPTTAK